MNHLIGSYVSFRLSPVGQAAIGGQFETETFQMRVVGVSELGVWLELEDDQCMLLKWAYFSTVVADYQEPGTAEPRKIGF